MAAKKPDPAQTVMGMPVHPRWTNPNPAVARWGFGPEGVKCKGCDHLFYNHGGTKKFIKCAKMCEVRGLTNGPGTDHRSGWDACKKFTPELPWLTLHIHKAGYFLYYVSPEGVLRVQRNNQDVTDEKIRNFITAVIKAKEDMKP